MIRQTLVFSILILPHLRGQQPRPALDCPGAGCQVQVASLPATSALSVNTVNSSVEVGEWTGSDILVRVAVHAAPQVASQVEVNISPGDVSVKGPSNQSWSVELKIDVPASTGLTIATVNGGITVHGVAGAILFDTVNGDASLRGVTGDVTGNAVNGNISIEVGGAHWGGQTLDVDTVKGDIEIAVPADCSAQVTASTSSGTIGTDFEVETPANTQRISFDLGNSGSIVMSAAKGTIELIAL